MHRRRLTVFPWGMLETTDYGDSDQEPSGGFDIEADCEDTEPPSCSAPCSEG